MRLHGNKGEIGAAYVLILILFILLVIIGRGFSGGFEAFFNAF